MGLFEPTHVIFVLVVALLVFGPKRLPEIARSAGRGLREFKESMSGGEPGAGSEAAENDVAGDGSPGERPTAHDR